MNKKPLMNTWFKKYIIASSKWIMIFLIFVSSLQYTIFADAPAIAFTDDVAAGPVTSDTVTVDRDDATVKTWMYDDDGVCSAVPGDYDKTDLDSMNQNDEANNGKYICLYAEDALGNPSTLASANPINIDITPPALIAVNIISNNANPIYAKQ